MTQQPKPPWQPWGTAPETGDQILVQVRTGDETALRFTYWDARAGGWYRMRFWDVVVAWRRPPPGPGDKPENAKLLEACKAMVLWFDAEDKNLGTFHDKMDLCKYAEWAARKALGQEVGEFEGVPKLVLVLGPPQTEEKTDD